VKIKGYHVDHSGIYTSDGEFTNKPSFLSFLTKPEPDTIRVFTDLDACVAGFCSLIKFSQKQAEYLLVTNQAHISKLTYELGKPLDKPFLIRYFTKRFFLIGEGSEYNSLENVATFSDASQYSTDLQRLDRSVTGFARAKQAKGVGEEVYNTYCEIGKSLGQRFGLTYEPPRSLISPISFFRNQVIEKLDLPKIESVPKQASLLALRCCKGGWAEAYKIGHFDKVYDYDINASYPYQVSKLLDLRPSNGTWIASKKMEHVINADYGYVSSIAKVSREVRSPLLIRRDETSIDRNCTPYGSFPVDTNVQMMRHCIEHKKAEFELLEGYFFYANSNAKLTELAPYAEWLYEERLKSTGMKKLMLKLMMVGGLYGNFIEVRGGSLTKDYFPMLAAEVQIKTQIEVDKFCIENNIDPLAITVDGVVSATKATKTPISGKFGEWKLDGEGKAIIVGPGTTAVQGNDPNSIFGLGYDWAMHYAKEHPDSDHFEMTEPAIVNLPDARAKNNIRSVGTVYQSKRVVYIGADIKRDYNDHPKTLKEFVSGQYPSKPFSAAYLQALSSATNSFENLMKGGESNE